jgi:UDP-N-acetylmuramoyl-tripeptide--D-alanyl-D-alanine ligase
MIKDYIKKYLAKSSRLILEKYRPKVIAITGSVGKTSAKEAIFAVVSSKYNARTNIKNYNNEFGLPFTVIGTESPKRSVFAWYSLFRKVASMLSAKGEYPEVLVLEMGIDRPGDMDYLVDIVRPSIAVLTTIGISHLQYFHSEDQILQEKSKILKYVDNHGFAILNYDDPKIRSLIPKLTSNIITYGQDPAALVRVMNYDITYDQSSKNFGVTFTIRYKSEEQEVRLKDMIGWPHVQACVTGVAAGIALGIPFEQACKALNAYEGQLGRLRLVPAMNNSYLIDDSYNAAPLSTKVALDELHKFPVSHKIAILGDMLELGKLSRESHENIAQEMINQPVDYFIAVGPEMKHAANRLKMLGFDQSRIFVFDKSTDAISKAKELVIENTAVLVKGSQGMRMEKISKALMRDPKKAAGFLPRQDSDWVK